MEKEEKKEVTIEDALIFAFYEYASLNTIFKLADILHIQIPSEYRTTRNQLFEFGFLQQLIQTLLTYKTNAKALISYDKMKDMTKDLNENVFFKGLTTKQISSLLSKTFPPFYEAEMSKKKKNLAQLLTDNFMHAFVELPKGSFTKFLTQKAATTTTTRTQTATTSSPSSSTESTRTVSTTPTSTTTMARTATSTTERPVSKQRLVYNRNMPEEQKELYFMPDTGDRLSDDDKKYCRSVRHISSQQDAWCLKDVNNNQYKENPETGKKCYNPYAVATAAVSREGAVTCFPYINWYKVPQDELDAEIYLKNKKGVENEEDLYRLWRQEREALNLQ